MQREIASCIGPFPRWLQRRAGPGQLEPELRPHHPQGGRRAGQGQKWSSRDPGDSQARCLLLRMSWQRLLGGPGLPKTWATAAPQASSLRSRSLALPFSLCLLIPKFTASCKDRCEALGTVPHSHGCPADGLPAGPPPCAKWKHGEKGVGPSLPQQDGAAGFGGRPQMRTEIRGDRVIRQLRSSSLVTWGQESV